MTKYVSFSCFGDKEIYLCGAIANAELVVRFYPDWTAVFYLDAQADLIAGDTLRDLGCKVFLRNTDQHGGGMFWRFGACELADAEAVIVRDTDSRITFREAIAVSEWLASGKSLHVMRDHPWHTNKIMGGMWGLQGAQAFETFSSILQSESKSQLYGEDQRFVSETVYPLFKRDVMVHDSFSRQEWQRKKFVERTAGEFIGEAIDCLGRPNHALRNTVVKFENQAVRAFVHRVIWKSQRLLKRLGP